VIAPMHDHPGCVARQLMFYFQTIRNFIQPGCHPAMVLHPRRAGRLRGKFIFGGQFLLM
jgi:hypothetical protein